MAWTSKYTAQFSKPLVRQICGIIKRDIRAALDYVAGTNVLPMFVSYHISKAEIVQFPGILVAAHDVVFDPEAEGTVHSAPIRLAIAVACAHQDRDVLAERVQDYVRAVDEILRSAWELTPADFLATDLALPHIPPFAPPYLSPGLTLGTLKDLWIAGHDLTEVLRAGTEGFKMGGTLTVIAEMEEM